MADSWHQLARVEECGDGTVLELVASGRVIALACVDGKYYAMDGICPHQGGPLGKGQLSGCVVTYPWHGWQYNVTDGRHETTPLQHTTFDVRLEDDAIMVLLPDDES